MRSGELSFREASDQAIESAIGASPDPDQRRDLLVVLTNSAVVLAAALGALGLVVGYGVAALVDDAIGRLLPRIAGVALVAPLLGLSIVWAVHWFLNDRDMPRQSKGDPPGRGSQPSDRDLLYAVPFIVLLGVFFALV